MNGFWLSVSRNLSAETLTLPLQRILSVCGHDRKMKLRNGSEREGEGEIDNKDIPPPSLPFLPRLVLQDGAQVLNTSTYKLVLRFLLPLQSPND